MMEREQFVKYEIRDFLKTGWSTGSIGFFLENIHLA